jgi:hypothetical protein
MTATILSDRAKLERALLLARRLKQLRPWTPLPGPQTMAYETQADIIGYGGAAGGGKSDLACGKAITQHRKVMMLRRVGTELTGIEDRLEELIGNKDGYNGQKKIWRMKRGDGTPLQIEFASLPNLGDERGYQGRPHDLLVFDEAANFIESQVRFLLGWLRTTTPGQKCQALLTFNPPTSAEGRWIIDFFGPWLDTKHPNPAAPGELRYFATLDGKDKEVENGEPFEHDGETITPLSRTFIPSRVSDNPHLMGTGYMATLQALPEPLRSQMLKGDFQAGIEDDAMQVIPTAWVDAAMARWTDLSPKPGMDSVGVDVARGGRDSTVIARRHANWYDKPLSYPGTQTPDGPSVAGLVVAATRDGAPIHIDVIGVGSSPYDFLRTSGMHVLGVNVSEAATRTDKSGRFTFLNQRSEQWWLMREDLDPANNRGICLPNDSRLRADLCAPTWQLQGKVVKVESRDEIVKRIGRSPDYASAYLLARMDTPNMKALKEIRGQRTKEYDPYA